MGDEGCVMIWILNPLLRDVKRQTRLGKFGHIAIG